MKKLIIAATAILAGSVALLFKMRTGHAFVPSATAPGAVGPGATAPPPRPPRSSFIRPDLIPVAEAAAGRHGVPVEGFVLQIWTESNFNPQAGSGAGAMGIAQFMPATAEQYGIDPWDPEPSLDAAARMMKNLHRTLGSWGLAAAAYNWGLGNVWKWQRGEKNPPKETRDYTARLAPAYSEADPLA